MNGLMGTLHPRGDLKIFFFRMLLKEETFYKEKNGYHNRNGIDIKQKQRFNSNK